MLAAAAGPTCKRGLCRHKRYVMEDRWMAIRWAIGTACENDVVIIAGKGHEDFQEFYQEGEFVKVRIRRLKPWLG